MIIIADFAVVGPDMYIVDYIKSLCPRAIVIFPVNRVGDVLRINIDNKFYDINLIQRLEDIQADVNEVIGTHDLELDAQRRRKAKNPSTSMRK